MPGARGPAKHAEFGTMRVVELHAIARLHECVTEVELRVIGQQCAGDDGGMGRTFVLQYHACGCAHEV